MLIQEGEARSTRADRQLARTLAGVAGALNTAGFYAAGLYSANMTGNISAFSDHVGIGELVPAALYLALIGTFISGAIVSTLLINAGRRRRFAGIYAFSILAEALLLGALGCADLWLPPAARSSALVFGLSFLIGLQNAVVTRISNARVRTTHVTGMITDIGIELGNLIDIARRREGLEDAYVSKSKLRLHTQTVASFLVGGVIGVLTFKAVGLLLLFIAALLLLAIAVRYMLVVQRGPGAA